MKPGTKPTIEELYRIRDTYPDTHREYREITKQIKEKEKKDEQDRYRMV